MCVGPPDPIALLGISLSDTRPASPVNPFWARTKGGGDLTEFAYFGLEGEVEGNPVIEQI